MADSSTSAITLRRIPYGEFDLILTLLTPDHGKISVFARSARKDARRFSGAVEPFSLLKVVLRSGRGRLAVLAEAALVDPLPTLRTDLHKTAYASCWSELVLAGMEEGAPQPAVYRLLRDALTALDRGTVGKPALHLFFLAKFAGLSGFFPEMTCCRRCNTPLDEAPAEVGVDIPSGGMACGRCIPFVPGTHRIAKGTLKALLWLGAADIQQASRIRLAPAALEESARFFEAFISHHLGRQVRSLSFLTHIRSRREEGRIQHVG